MRSLTRRFLINKLNITITLIISIILSTAHFMVSGVEEGYSLVAPFSGCIPGSLFIPHWSFFAMTNLFIIYLVGVFYERLIAQGISSHIIRYLKKGNWVKELEFTVITGTLILSLVYIGVSLILGILFVENIINEIWSFAFFSLLWIMEIIVVGELFITLCICIKNSLISFIIMLLFYMMIGLPDNISCYIPFGISSVKRMKYYNLNGIWEISLIFAILIITFFISRFILYRWAKNRIFDL
ncbi:hypothetical protein HAHI6034_07850 [Hathewaya histolytica]|uniref:Uncharacterized protein n=1 Tax=Hathewaya histolytica TaxID=1498 RepID=A0A4U9QVE2_HATHI|nr:hypothetical protein [Hathewaya histolytica]VTQ82008.1 Uncharacterised protein [Hathewaya histolytica]